MTVSHIYRQTRFGHGGTFRPLKIGEPIEAGDIVIHDTWLESPSETSVGQTVTATDKIIRLEYEKGRK